MPGAAPKRSIRKRDLFGGAAPIAPPDPSVHPHVIHERVHLTPDTALEVLDLALQPLPLIRWDLVSQELGTPDPTIPSILVMALDEGFVVMSTEPKTLTGDPAESPVMVMPLVTRPVPHTTRMVFPARPPLRQWVHDWLVDSVEWDEG